MVEISSFYTNINKTEQMVFFQASNRRMNFFLEYRLDYHTGKVLENCFMFLAFAPGGNTCLSVIAVKIILEERHISACVVNLDSKGRDLY